MKHEPGEYILGIPVEGVKTKASFSAAPSSTFLVRELVIPTAVATDFDVLDVRVNGVSVLDTDVRTPWNAPGAEPGAFIRIGLIQRLCEHAVNATVVVRNRKRALRNFTACIVGPVVVQRERRKRAAA